MKYKKSSQGKFIQEKDYSKSVLFSPSEFLEKGYLLQVVTIPPHTKQRLHYHKKQTEVSYILEGESLFVFNNEEILAKPGDSFICEPEDKHFVWNTSDKKFQLIVFKIDYKDDDSFWLEE